MTNRESAYVLPLGEVGIEDTPLVGGKNSSLGEMIKNLTPIGVRVPGGFAITAFAYRYFIESANLEAQLRKLFTGLDVEDIPRLQQVGKQARSLIEETKFPQDLQDAITADYTNMCLEYGTMDVAVRSSATAEDLPEASFAGQQSTYLNIVGVKAVLDACRRCFASLFTDRAISYRHTMGFDHFDVALSVTVQKMVRSDLANSGVMFTIEPETGFRNIITINAAYGLGENVVGGTVNPDQYLVHKPTLELGYNSIIEKKLGSKSLKMIYDEGGLTKNVAVSEAEQTQFTLTDEEIKQLARWAVDIEKHYSSVHGVYTPMDIEWAKDGITNELFILQARPETVESQKNTNVLRSYRLLVNTEEQLKALVEGTGVGQMIGAGKVSVILDTSKMNQFLTGVVLVTERTDPDWEPIMKRARAIVTNAGGRTCHAAIIARELGIPAILGCGNATTVLSNGQEVTVSCAEGKVYSGLLPFEVQEQSLENLPQTRTQILMNVGNPEEAMRLSQIPSGGVGLARTEFIIANQIKIHPLALIHFDTIKDNLAKVKIANITAQYKDKSQYFVDKLAQGIGKIAAAFYPMPVIVRMSDFKSNEYANLLGGKQFEPNEENPMIGWRGASRYYDERYLEAYALECVALKRVREEFGLTNVIPMIPFCRTPDEGRKVLAEIAKHGLVQGVNGLQVYVMCELPSNVLMADEFLEIFDGFSIGSNDLTQLTLGLDRDSELVAHLFNERNTGVKRMIAMAISAAKKHGKKVGICGQAPSDYPEFARFLVEQGIDSISLNPDSVLKTLLHIADVEAEINQ